MNHIKSYGTCTRNEQGMFEIQWEVESNWFKRLFKIQTEFKYMCDYEVGKRNKLEIINILEKDGKINSNGIKSYIGLDRFEARKKIVNELKNLNLIDKIESIKNKIPYGDRSSTIIEPLLTEQCFVDAKK